MLEKMNRCYPAWLNLLPLLLTLLTALYVLVSYDQLPARMATHFNFQGLPDGFGSKNGIWVLPVIGVIITIGMLAINIFAIMRPDDPTKIFNMDPKQLEAIGTEKLESMRSFMARSMYLIILLVALMMSYGSWGEIQVALGRQTGLGIWMMVLAGALLIVTIYMTVKAVGLTLTSPAKK